MSERIAGHSKLHGRPLDDDGNIEFSSACKWCADGGPEWSHDALVYIHRRDSLDKACLDPKRIFEGVKRAEFTRGLREGVRQATAAGTESGCRFCDAHMPLKKYFDGRTMHFDGFSAWTACLKPAVAGADGGPEMNKEKK